MLNVCSTQTIEMASNIRISSYNMHGYNNGSSMLKTLCLNNNITLIQEHWLLHTDLYKLDLFDVNFQSFGYLR